MKDKKPTPENTRKDPVDRINSFNIPDAPTFPGETNSGINNPNVELPAFNPPVPNRAWTAMRQGVDIDALSEDEKRDLYLGRDNII